MDISRVKYNLNKQVRASLPRMFVNGEYLLTGCIIRRKPNGEFFYQAELTDFKSSSKAILISELDAVEEIRS